MITGMNTISTSEFSSMAPQLPEIPAELAKPETFEPHSNTQNESPGKSVDLRSRKDAITHRPTDRKTEEKLKRPPVGDRMLRNLLRAFEQMTSFRGVHSSGGIHSSDVQDVNAQMLSIIDDPSLSIEEKIVLVSGLIQEKTENDLEGLLRQQAGQTSSGHGSSDNGLLSTIGTIVGGTAGALAGGPAGAAAGASLGASVGSRIESMKGNGKTGGSNSKNLEARIQLLMQRLNRTQSMLSNMLQAMHQTKRSVVQNIRV